MQAHRATVPAAVRPEILAILASPALFCGGALVWAALAELDAGALAQGGVIPAGRVKTVQHLEGGIISKLSVKEGDAVQRGQELLVLDES